MHDKMTIGSSVRLTETGVEQQIDIMGEITRRFVEVSQQQMEEGLRKKLIELGWTPPGVMPTQASLVEKEVAEVYLKCWYETAPGCTGEREELDVRFLRNARRLPVGTKLYSKQE